MSLLPQTDGGPTTVEGVRKINFLQAVSEAQFEEMERDPRVILMGQDMHADMFGAAKRLLEAHGDRVFDTPISEASVAGVAAGAAMVGMRPIVEFGCASFMYLAFDQIVNMVAKSRYIYGGSASIPVVYRSVMLYKSGLAAQHSDRPYSLFTHNPGLKIAVPSDAYDAKGLLKAAIRDEDPVVIFEDSQLWTSRCQVPSEDYVIPFGKGVVRRLGTDITLVGIGATVPMALKAADILAKTGVDAEVLDPRTLVPFDKQLLLESVSKTGRLVIADIGHPTCSVASEIAAIVAQEAFYSLKGPIMRVNTANTHLPYNSALEAQLYPTPEKIAEAALSTLGARV